MRDAKRLLEGTTPGPWRVSDGGEIVDVPEDCVVGWFDDAVPANGALIAAAPALAAALAEHEAEGCAGCARVEALAAAREARAEAAALRTEREAAVELLRIEHLDDQRHQHRLSCRVCAFLARTDTGGQE